MKDVNNEINLYKRFVHKEKNIIFFFFSSRRRHTRCLSDWSSDVCSSDLLRSRASADDRGVCNARGPTKSPCDRPLYFDLPGFLVEISDAKPGAQGSTRCAADTPRFKWNHHPKEPRTQPGRRAFH